MMKTEKYILDTNIISYLYQTDSVYHQMVAGHMAEFSDAEICVSLVSLYEMECAIAIAMDGRIKDTFISMCRSVQQKFSVLSLSAGGSEIFGFIKAAYMRKTGISKNAVKRHDIDFMIAGSAVSENAVLVSNDRIFEHVKEVFPDFLLENWTV